MSAKAARLGSDNQTYGDTKAASGQVARQASGSATSEATMRSDVPMEERARIGLRSFMMLLFSSFLP